MAIVFTSIDQYCTKFYLKEKDFKRFSKLSEEELSLLSKKVYKMQEKMSDNTQQSKLERYQKTLQYLTNPLIHVDLKTFDERIAYLIMTTDPNLVAFKEFLKLNLISISEINKVTDKNERNYLKELRKQTILEYESKVREKIGFYDVKLLKYEEIFFKRYFNKKELVTEIESNNQDNIITKAKSLKNFNNISNERFKELVDIAETWLTLVPKNYNYKVASYSVTTQHKLLGLKNTEEQLALFILLIDNNLDMLRIHEEESMIQNTKERITEQFGYFNIELLVLERKFHNRFYPDKQLTIWTKTKTLEI